MGRSGSDLRNQMYSLGIAGLTEVDGVADPVVAALVALARLDIIGRLDRRRIGSYLLLRRQAPLPRCLFVLPLGLTTIMTRPHVASGLDFSQLAERGRCLRRVKPS